jgi:hypothetical protein
MPANMPKEDGAKRSNVMAMPNRMPKANPTPEELELWRLEELDEAGYFQPRMRRYSDLRKICKTLR